MVYLCRSKINLNLQIMNRATFSKITVVIFLVLAFASCNSLNKMAKNFNTVTYEVNPEVLETHGGKVSFTVKGNIPPKFFNRKAAVFFQPVVKYDGGEIELTPMLLKGERVDGEGTTINYERGGSFTYSETFDFKSGMEVSELMTSSIAFLPKNSLTAGMTFADAMKLPKAINLGEVKLADGIIATSMRVDLENEVREIIEIGEEVIEKDASGNIRMDLYQVSSDYAIDLMELAPHGYEKVTVVSEQAFVYYAKNLHNFDPSLKWNKQENVLAQMENLENFVRKGWEIKDIEINGWASPEGEETFNEGLSERRAKTANDMLVRSLTKLTRERNSAVTYKKPSEDINFKIIGHGPDWNGFLRVVEGSQITDKRPILNVVKSSDVLKREQEIRNMINIYPELEDYILPPLRRAEIKIDCYEPKKTDAEIARLATSNPKELTEAELLYAATLTDDWNTQYSIYKAATQNFPNSWKGFNNAGYLAMKLGNTDEALTLLRKAENLNKNNGQVMNNIGVAYAMQNDFNQAENYFLNANNMGVNNNYNLGLIDIQKGDYKAALTKFAGLRCNYNVALAQLLAGNNSAAATNLECARKNGITYYLMAITGVRTSNQTMMMNNLKKAIKANSKLKEEARMDREFIKYFELPEFQAIVN
jgi:tetratricopeptide (TPR) repeat protein